MSLDQIETPNRFAYVDGNPINTTDPSGLCGQPTNWWDPVDANCYYSADGLARRFSNGDQSAYNSLLSILIQLSWGDLKVIEATGTLGNLGIGPRQTLDNASIIPKLARQNFGATMQAFMQHITCPNTSLDQRILGVLGMGITAYGRLIEAIGEVFAKGLNTFAIAGTGAAAALYGSQASSSAAGTVSAGGSAVAGVAGSVAGGVSIGYGFADVWDSLKQAFDNLLYTSKDGLPWNTALVRAPTFENINNWTKKNWDRRGCYVHCVELRPTPRVSIPDNLAKCKELEKHSPFAAGAPTCKEAENVIDAYTNLLTEANGCSCFAAHCDKDQWG